MAFTKTDADPLRAGVSRTDVTPPVGVYLCGYPEADRHADYIHDPLYATALVLSRGDTQAAIVSLDWIMIEEVDRTAIARGVQARTGIPAAHVTVCAIQTHTGPSTMSAWGWGEKNEEYVEEAIPRIVDAIAQAHAALQPVRVGIGTGNSDIGVNRRGISEDHGIGLTYNPWGVYDPTMTLLRFEGESGTVATLIHYGAHPTALSAQRFVSRDWPGVMVDRVETITGAPALYINGAVGDVAPRTSIHRAVGDGLIAATEVGLRAAHDALSIYHAAREWRDDLVLRVLSAELPLPYAPLPPLEEARRALEAARPNRESWGVGQCDFRYWEAVIAAHGYPVAEYLPFQQSITALGPVALVPFAGEPFTEIVLRLRHLSPFPYTLCASTTNGRHGYYVTGESRVRGGYEVWVAKAYGARLLADNIDDVLVEGNLRLLRELYIRR